LGLLPTSFWFLTFLAIPAFITFQSMIKGQSNHYCFENTKSWFCMYMTFFIFALMFSTLIIVDTIIKI
jgi:hypothetical protein